MKPKEMKEKKTKQPKIKIPRTPFAWVYLFFSLLLVAGGIAFVVFPLEAANWTARILGGLTVLFFLFLFVLLCAREKKRGVSFFLRLFAYLLAILSGGYLIFSPDTALAYLSIAVGVYALIDAGFKLRLAISGCRYRVLLWWALTVTAGLAAVGGLVLLRFLPTWEADITTTAVLMGITMLFGGLQNFIGAFERTAVEQAQAKEATDEHTTVVVIDPTAAQTNAPAVPAAEEPAAEPTEEKTARETNAEKFDALLDRVLQEDGETAEGAPTDEEIDAMVDQFIGEVMGELDAEATEEPVEEPVEEPAEEPAEEPTEQSAPVANGNSWGRPSGGNANASGSVGIGGANGNRASSLFGK